MMTRWMPLALLFATVTGACGPMTEIVRKDHMQTVTVYTEPPGATLYQRVDGDAIELGQAPVALRSGYSVLHRRTDPTPCALDGALDGASLGADIGGKAGGIIGLFGLALGAAAGAAACQADDGPFETQGTQLVLLATMPGFLPARQVIQIPYDGSSMTLKLIPDPNAKITMAPAPSAPAPLASDDTSSGRQPAHPGVQASVGEPTRRPGLAIYPVEVEVRDAAPVPGLAEDLTGKLAAALDEVGFAGPDPEAGPELVLETRLLAIGDLCVLSANLHAASDLATQRVATARCTCDRSAVDAAIKRLAERLVPSASGLAADALVEGPPPSGVDQLP